jgi:hypothetical protein
MALGSERTQILSTETMIEYARCSPTQRFLIANETASSTASRRRRPARSSSAKTPSAAS